MENKNQMPAIGSLLQRINEVKVTKQGNKIIIEVPDDTTPLERDVLVNEALRIAAGGESYKLESIDNSKQELKEG